MENNKIYQELCAAALEARRYSYSPYSVFSVGAALLCSDGSIYTGCNIENAAFTPTNCAERTAFFKAVSEGRRAFTAIAIAGGPAGRDASGGILLDECPPCGVCRQVMMEFCDPDSFTVIMARSEDNYRAVLLGDMLPLGFGPANVL